MDPFVGEIRMFAGTYAPRGWAFCQGQLLNVSSNAALFSLLGTQYGGNGQTTFGLPDLRGRAAIGIGGGGALPPVVQGQVGGTNAVTLTSSNVPAQQVTIPAQNLSVAIPAVEGDANAPAPSSANVLAKPFDSTGSGAAADIYSSTAANTNLKPFNVTVPQQNVVVGGAPQPFSVQNPYLGMNFIIALEGVYPSRN